ncbi:MAG: type II toxin-antitoxin system HicA family toxin [Nitrospirota bacterium]
MAKLRDLLRFLKAHGWEQDRQESSHRVWRHRDGRRIVIAAHESQELSRSKLSKILKDAGHTLEDFFGR